MFSKYRYQQSDKYVDCRKILGFIHFRWVLDVRVKACLEKWCNNCSYFLGSTSTQFTSGIQKYMILWVDPVQKVIQFLELVLICILHIGCKNLLLAYLKYKMGELMLPCFYTLCRILRIHLFKYGHICFNKTHRLLHFMLPSSL